ncbi:hypothetical protein C0J52_04420, partial [Blattella germanica]
KSANRSGYVKIDVKLNLEQFKPYAGNAINGHFVFPSFAYLKIVLDTLGFLKNVDSNSLAVAFEELTFPNQLQFMRFGCVAKVQWANNWVVFGETLLQIIMMHSSRDWRKLKYPAAIQKIVINPSTFLTQLTVFVMMRENDHLCFVKLQEEEKYIRGSGKAYDMIVVTKEHDLETAASLIKSNGGFLLTMSEDTSWLVNQNLVIAGSQKFDNVKLVLYRKNGEWSNLCYLPIDTSSCVPKFSLKFSLENHKLDFYGLNLGNLSTYDTCLSSKVRETELGPVDFSGYSKTGERIMGFAVFDELLDKVTPDKAFTWEIPKSWSYASRQARASDSSLSHNSKEIFTIQLQHKKAYNALFLKGKLQHDESVLIHAGWSAIGQAAIILALDHGCKVFTSVSNEEQKRFIKQRFPQVSMLHIILYSTLYCV